MIEIYGKDNSILEEEEKIPKGFIRSDNMEFIKTGDKYLIKNSNGKIIDEKEKLELEKKGLVLEDITGKNCQKETTKKIRKINKKIKEIEEVEANDTIQEATTTD